MKKYLENEFVEKEIFSKKEFDEFINFRKENDEWKKVRLADVEVLGVANEPLFQQGEELEVEVIKNDFKHNTILPLDEENTFCIREGLGIFISVPVAKFIAPLSYTGYKCTLERAGMNCPVMTNFKSTSRKRALSHTKKQQELNDAFGLNTPDSKSWGWILYRDGRIPAFNSSAYGIMNCWELVEALEEKMAEEHPDFKFKNAKISEEFLIVKYLLNDPVANDSFTNLLKSFGMNVEKVELGMGLSTSDVGLSEVSAFPVLYIDGVEMRLGKGVGVRHDSCNNITKFEEKLPALAALFDECEDQIEKLGNTDIKNVVTAVNLICAEHPSIFMNEFVDKVRQTLRLTTQSSGTAMDVYLALYQIVEEYIKAKHPSMTRQLMLLDQVSKMMFLDYTKYDR